ncbi:steroidogenic acute regulatory protein-like [Odontomachus brunneus]|uniref:steroidogenic acute regulatory protein-like n=1 Tax=Odontomachus brunneus TaxID=486640 RepID=UPI0013F1FD91|nr:steroidogenic acute regulatory protein-like [Odontomachus brunneus]XP_032687028.1 steroidogenic acute regulatory protein-like [Odontomachus brunneus]XP_032687030.1 steroidogenic acute regulatory protein-like [Odontomachus brunneus]
MSDDERQIRMAAEAILSGSINSQRSSVTQHSITRTPDIVLSEDLIAGARHNGRMSHVRRSFCLFVTFDLLLTFLMWLICTMIAGQSLKTAFVDQVVHYHIKTSLFDIVMAAICRFTVLLLFYALLYINHWIIIAISTAATCVFLIGKVFAFDWSSTNQPVFQVLLIITSFVLAWAEAWFFDFRVIPQEIQARNWFRNHSATERSPLIQTVSESRQYSAVDHMSTFFTPMDSDNSDNDEDISRKQGDTSSVPHEVLMCIAALTPDEIDDYKTKASKLLQNCHDLLTSKEWKVETTTTEGDVVSYMQPPKPGGRIVKITGIIDAPASTLVDWLFEGIEEHPSWNKLVMESVKLQNIDENTDIVYQSTSPQGGGLITARDFIILRHRNKCGNFYVSSGVSIPTTTIPNRKHMIRGENGVGCWAAEELSAENSNKCRFTWILNTNLKGWIPQKVVDRSLSTALIDFMTYLRKHLVDSEK